jgi:hypothetical protein
VAVSRAAKDPVVQIGGPARGDVREPRKLDHRAPANLAGLVGGELRVLLDAIAAGRKTCRLGTIVIG